MVCAIREIKNRRPVIFLPSFKVEIRECGARLGTLLRTEEETFYRGGMVVELTYDENGTPPVPTEAVRGERHKAIELHLAQSSPRHLSGREVEQRDLWQCQQPVFRHCLQNIDVSQFAHVSLLARKAADR